MKISGKTTLAIGVVLGLALGVFFTDLRLVPDLFAATPKLKTDNTQLSQEARPAFTSNRCRAKLSGSGGRFICEEGRP